MQAEEMSAGVQEELPCGEDRWVSFSLSRSLYVVVIWSLKFDVFPCLALRLTYLAAEEGFDFFSGARLQGSFVLRCPRSPRLPLFPRSFASVVVFVWRSVQSFRECFNSRIRASPSLGLLCWLNSIQHLCYARARVNGALIASIALYSQKF